MLTATDIRARQEARATAPSIPAGAPVRLCVSGHWRTGTLTADARPYAGTVTYRPSSWRAGELTTYADAIVRQEGNTEC